MKWKSRSIKGNQRYKASTGEIYLFTCWSNVYLALKMYLPGLDAEVSVWCLSFRGSQSSWGDKIKSWGPHNNLDNVLVCPQCGHSSQGLVCAQFVYPPQQLSQAAVPRPNVLTSQCPDRTLLSDSVPPGHREPCRVFAFFFFFFLSFRLVYSTFKILNSEISCS